jgi:hypothetical protein
VMSFKTQGAVDTRVNYLVKPAAFDEPLSWVGQGLVVMVNFATWAMLLRDVHVPTADV